MNVYLSLQELWNQISISTSGLVPVSGDCMEAQGICDGDFIEVDFNRMPRPPVYGEKEQRDNCLCFGSMEGRPPIMMCKAYNGVFGSMQQVTTCYKYDAENYRLNFSFEPIAILGVVAAVYDKDMREKWRIDTADFPKEFHKENTFKFNGFDSPKKICAVGQAPLTTAI